MVLFLHFPVVVLLGCFVVHQIPNQGCLYYSQVAKLVLRHLSVYAVAMVLHHVIVVMSVCHTRD